MMKLAEDERMQFSIAHKRFPPKEGDATAGVGSTSTDLPTVLLVEPDADRAAVRSLFLQAADYAVLRVNSAREVRALSGTVSISAAIVSEGFERASLRGTAESVRRQWPSARILILGRAQRILEDHLYDDAIEEPFQPQCLLDALRALLLNQWSERSQPMQISRERAATRKR